MIYTEKKQKLILEFLLSSNDLFARCTPILKASYFDVSLRQLFVHIMDYYAKYSALPKPEVVSEELEMQVKQRIISKDEFIYISDECERFARYSAIKEAIQTSLSDINEGNYGKVTHNVVEAAKVSLERDVGVDLYENPEERLAEYAESLAYISTGIKELDDALGGGFVRQQFTLFSANSGGGKSIMLSNLGDYLAASGLHVVYISLELQESMVYTRMASIATGEDAKTWKENIPEIARKILKIKEAGAGSYIIKRMPNGTTANDAESYLKQYELKYGRKPDVIVLDYIDLAHPNGGIKTMSISDQDKFKSEQFYELAVKYDAVMLSASQQNREALRMSAPDQGVIAGGITKVNTVDNYISIYMSPQMRLEGLMLLHFLKARSSSAMGEKVALAFNSHNLQITGGLDANKAKKMLEILDKTREGGAKQPFKFGKKSEEKKSSTTDTSREDIKRIDITGFSEDNDNSSDSLLEVMDQI